MQLSEPVKAILEHLRSDYGDTEITAQQALTFFCGGDDVLLKDLDDEALLQLALIQSHDALKYQIHSNAGLELALRSRPNRATRRHP